MSTTCWLLLALPMLGHQEEYSSSKPLLTLPKVALLRWRPDSAGIAIIFEPRRRLAVYRINGTRQFNTEVDLSLLLAADFIDKDTIAFSAKGESQFGIDIVDMIRNKRSHIKLFNTPISFIKTSSDSRLLAVGGSEGEIGLLDIEKRSLVWSLSAKADMVEDLFFDNNSQILGSKVSPFSLRLFDVRTGRLIKTIDNNRERILASVFLDDGALLTFDSSRDLVSFAPKTFKQVRSNILPGKRLPVCAAFSHDGKQLVIGETQGVVEIYTVPDAKKIGEFRVDPAFRIRNVAIAPNGKQILVNACDELRALDGKESSIIYLLKLRAEAKSK